jgi:hypothetical protein
MQTELLTLNRNEAPAQAEASLSFRPFVNFLKTRIGKGNAVKSQFYKTALEKFEKTGSKMIGDNESVGYKELMEMVYLILTPLATSEKEDFWALSSPLSGTIIYSTDSFYRFLTEQKSTQRIRFNGDRSYGRQQKIFIYRLILERFYNIPLVGENEMVYSSVDPHTRLPRFYRIHTDTRFVDITIKDKLPELHYTELEAFLQEDAGIEQLEKLLPLSLFRFEGFSVITLTDVTIQQALDSIRESLMNHSCENDECSSHIMQSLKILGGNPDLQFGLLPFLDVNGKSVFLNQECSQSMAMSAAQRYGLSEETFNALVHDYRKNPKTLVFNQLSEEKQLKHPFLKGIKKTGVHSYAIIPAYYQKQLTGILEVYSYKETILDEILFSSLHAAMPLIAQLLKHATDEFNAELKDVIQDKFTSLQPSVQWKFNEVAWKYMQERHTGVAAPMVETVRFDNLYPLYGAIDVRNSTSQRNKAVHDDLSNQLSLLKKTLEEVQKVAGQSSAGPLIFECKRWAQEINHYFATKDEVALNRFLDTEVNPFLRQMKKHYPATKNTIDEYLNGVDEETGAIYANRRELEESLQLVNTELNHYFEKEQKKLRSQYPIYFEKFRTDGVEYDIYTGQSIAPDTPFEGSIVHELRKWQLTSMAEIVNRMDELTPRMPRPLQTTQLIFVHPDPIDISFRNDERRFDVEGAYNIRYEVIKKRIDKVLIRGTQERLTQPGKIAMVYFNEPERNEYIGYIRQLQKEAVLNDDLEELQLEELQGVTGLKSLRVGVTRRSTVNKPQLSSIK